MSGDLPPLPQYSTWRGIRLRKKKHKEEVPV